jgi:hypothetical protein
MVRIDSREKAQRKASKTLQFNWQPYGELGNKIFTHITFGHYSPPDSLNGILDYDMTSFDLGRVYNDFEEISKAYKTDEVLFLYGDDFTFDVPHKYFNNIEALMKAFNESSTYKDKISFKYSTPSIYFNALKNYSVDFPTIKDIDFFPYMDFKLDYWTGYFTSRPYLKGFVRDAGYFVNMASKLLLNHLLANKQGFDIKGYFNQIYGLRRELNIAQHHDGVSGTGREAVSNDYIERMRNGISNLSTTIVSIIEEELQRIQYDGKFLALCTEAVAYKDCINKVVSKDNLEKGIIVVLVNPQLHGDIPFKVRVEQVDSLRLTDITDNTDISIDYICDGVYVKESYCTVNTMLSFRELEVFKIISLKAEEGFNTPLEAKELGSDKIVLINYYNYLLEFDPRTQNFIQIDGSVQTSFKANHGYFTYDRWNDPERHNRSGAYLMGTDGDTITNYNLSKSNYIQGKDLAQINLIYEHSLIKLRIYNKEQYKYTIDTESIIFSGRPNKVAEFILAISSDINNTNENDKTVFYTDTNGLKIKKRIRDTREFYNYQVDDPTASNFYPIGSLISIKDKNDGRIVNVYNDRAQGGTSLRQGEIYIDLNRWSNDDDRKGLATGINEGPSTNQNFHINHWIVLNKSTASVNSLRLKPLYATYSPNESVSLNRMKNKYLSQYLANRLAIPPEYTDFRVKYLYSLLYENDACFDVNFYFTNEKSVLLQFYNKHDDYLNDSSNECVVKMNPDLSYNVVKLNGFDRIKEIDRMKFLGKNDNNEYKLKPHEFLTILFEFSIDYTS